MPAARDPTTVYLDIADTHDALRAGVIPLERDDRREITERNEDSRTALTALEVLTAQITHGLETSSARREARAIPRFSALRS